MFKKILNKLFKEKPLVLTNEVKTTDSRITDVDINHVIYQWHGDIYMDMNGYTFEVKKKVYNISSKELKRQKILNSPDID